MARKIIMTGDEAQYIERRGANCVTDDREIRMEGRQLALSDGILYQSASGGKTYCMAQNRRDGTANAYNNSQQPPGVEATDGGQDERTGIEVLHQTGRAAQISKA